MINQLHALLHRPAAGWDPVPAAHARSYAEHEWQITDEALVDRLGQWIGGFQGKRVLDLGSGPGQYAVAFAMRGAHVVCHDVSRTYLDIARDKAQERGVGDRMAFSLGYLDHAGQLQPGPWDLVFNRLCWYYCFNDRSFAGMVFRLMRPGGRAYIDSTHAAYQHAQLGRSARLRTKLNQVLGVKIGHPNPPRGRIEQLFRNYPVHLEADYGQPFNDRLWLQRTDDRGGP